MPYRGDMCLCERVFRSVLIHTIVVVIDVRRKKEALCMPTPFYEAEYRNEGFYDIRTIIVVAVTLLYKSERQHCSCKRNFNRQAHV